ncbi:MAG TPA: hypothetical protein VGY54_25430 [Polyangiaceae bacterium]|jgi:hypothetical protein|nr:hypothetical protein [Polyangiaceae bacterium]
MRWIRRHARPRATKDLDVRLDADPENVAKACSGLRTFGAPASIVEDLLLCYLASEA